MGATTSFDGCIIHGPWGGSQGKSWIYMPEGFIKKITIVRGWVIESIKFQSDSCAGETESSFFGGKGGNRTDTIYIDYPNEYLMSISGTYGSFGGSVVVMSLCFDTNQNRYGPYGSDTGNCFSYDGKGGVIVGFHGRVDKYLDAIGIYVMPESLAFGRNSTCEDNSTHELCSSMSRMAMPREVGPWGASGGKPWDDGVFSTVKQVNLDGTNEYLTGISGFHGPVEGYNGLEAIVSITFHTNKTIHGPYGQESGAGYVYFTSTASPGKVVGFHGRSSGFLNAIGVHMEYF